ncbi:ribonuclease HI family protein [Massilia varians]|uniref:ribonuclease HI family protein n=1 Tax=Massilia varians TaxID=457921 RepID=UPI00255662C4|nr:ribonuclease HI family protein [Massilia varians]MDK6078106.1 ribonuclease HI family protein [Massilia varians]
MSCPPPDHAALLAAAFKEERATSRKLAARTGMPEAEALRATLCLRAGVAGLDQLLAVRAAERLRSEHGACARRALAAAALARRGGANPAPAAWRAWFDGSARPNPGRCGIGAVLEGPGGVRIELSREAGHGNSSEAEYLALVAVLEAAVEHGVPALAIEGDSQVVIDDVHAPDSASAPALRAYRARVRALLERLPGSTLRWIPRHKNRQADALSQRAVPPHPTDETHAPDQRRTQD